MKFFQISSVLFVICFVSIGTVAQAARCNVPGNASKLAALAGQLMNQERSKNGRKSLAAHPTVQAAAQVHACDMSVKGYFSHVGQDRSKPKRRLQRAGCRAGLVAENIAVGQTDPQQLVREWMASPAHRKNMLLGRGATHYGIGVADAGNAFSHGYLWVLVVARGC